MTTRSKIYALIGLALIGLGLLELKARADYNVTQGSGTTIFAFTCFTTKVCPAHVLIDDAGTEIGSNINDTIGAVADAAASTGGTGSLSAKLRLITTQLNSILSGVTSSLPSGTNPIGRNYFGAAQLSSAALDFSSSGNNTAVTRSVGTIKVYGISISCASALTSITFQNGTEAIAPSLCLS